MNTNMKRILITAILITLISGTAAALIETDWQYGTRNPLPDDPSYIRYDFESPSGSFMAYSGVVNFMKVESEYLFYPDKWGTATIGGRGYHIYPKDFYHNLDGSQVDYIYVVNGQRGALPLFWRCTNVKCEWWPGSRGRIEFPNGSSDISFLISNGAPVQMKAYDKTGKFIGSSGVAYRNIDRIPPDPSNFTRVSFKTEKPVIAAVEIVASNNNFWIMDDLVIGGLTEPPPDYNYAAERLKLLIGAEYLEYGLGYDPIMERFLTPEEIMDDIPDPCVNRDTKELFFGIGIYDENAIVWAFNEDSDVVNWANINDQEKHDFTIEVEYGEQRPGDVFFLDYDADGCYDEVGIFIEPQYDPETGMLKDIIRIIPEQGVHYSSSEFIHALYGEDADIITYTCMDIRRLPDDPKGGHSPYPKLPAKFWI